MYDTTDPRSALNAPAKSTVPPPTEFAAAEYAKFYETKPQEDDKNGIDLKIDPPDFSHLYEESLSFRIWKDGHLITEAYSAGIFNSDRMVEEYARRIYS